MAASYFGNPFVDAKIASKVSIAREHFEPILQELRSLDPSRLERTVTELQSGQHNFYWDFGVFVEDLERQTKKWHMPACAGFGVRSCRLRRISPRKPEAGSSPCAKEAHAAP